MHIHNIFILHIHNYFPFQKQGELGGQQFYLCYARHVSLFSFLYFSAMCFASLYRREGLVLRAKRASDSIFIVHICCVFCTTNEVKVIKANSISVLTMVNQNLVWLIRESYLRYNDFLGGLKYEISSRSFPTRIRPWSNKQHQMWVEFFKEGEHQCRRV